MYIPNHNRYWLVLEKDRRYWAEWNCLGLLKVIVIFLMIFVCIPGIGFSEEIVQIHNGYFKGNDYVKWDDRNRAIYIAGLVDGMLLSPFFDTLRSKLEWFERCVIERMTSSQVTAIVDKFMRENPERWHEPMHILAYVAIKMACKPNQKK